MSDLIKITQKGSFDKTDRYLATVKASTRDIKPILERYGRDGVNALAEATPRDTGLTAQSWNYEIVEKPGYISIRWTNSHIEKGRPIAILLQYGHGTRTGGWVEGRDYIMPAIQPIFDKILADVTKEVS